MASYLFYLIYIGLFSFILNWFLNQDMTPLNNYISDYVHSSNGILTTSGFLIIGIGVLLLFLFYPTSIQLLNFELCLFGSLYIILGIFPVDKGSKITIKGVIHTVAAHLCFEPFSIIVLFLIIKDEIANISILVLTIISFSGGIMMIIFKERYKGLFQRISIISQLIILRLLYLD